MVLTPDRVHLVPQIFRFIGKYVIRHSFECFGQGVPTLHRQKLICKIFSGIVCNECTLAGTVIKRHIVYYIDGASLLNDALDQVVGTLITTLNNFRGVILDTAQYNIVFLFTL